MAASKRPLVKPPMLKRGDLVGLCAPSGFLSDTVLERAVRQMEALGFRVKLSEHIRARRGNTGGSIAQRMADLHDLFRDPEVRCIWPARGGSGVSQILPHLDYGLMRRHPKALIGYSDITALHLAVLRHAGLVSFHGPVAASMLNDYWRTYFEAVLMHPRPETVLHMSVDHERRAGELPEYRARTVHGGSAVGPLIGGNLSVLSALAGTPYAADYRGAILFLEDWREEAYRIDRMLTQLNQSLPLRHAAGAMLGVFRRTESEDRESTLTPSDVFDDHFGTIGMPCAYGLSFGHVAHNLTLPMGVCARFDADAMTITLLEAAVSPR